MANDYGQLYHSFWTDPKVRQLTADQRLLLAYFFSSPHSNMAGLYVNPQAYAAHETGLPLAAVQAAMGQPLAAFLSWDGDTNEVLVFKMARRQVGSRILFEDKRWAHIHGIVLGAHSARLRQEWYDLHRDWVVGLRVPFPTGRAPLGRGLVEGDSARSTPLNKGGDGAGDPPSGGGSDTEAGAYPAPSKPRTEQEQNRTPAAAVVPAATATPDLEAIRSQLPEAYRPAFDDLLRRAPNVRGFCAELHATHTAMPGHGPGYAWDIVGHALHDIWVTGAPVSPRALRQFCADLVTGKSAPAVAVDGTTEFSALLAAERAKNAKAVTP